MKNPSSLNFSTWLLVLGFCWVGPFARAQITFDPAASTAVFERPDGVASGDFDGDGDRDIAVSSDTPDKVSVFLNDGSGLFSPGPVVFVGAGRGAAQLVAADFDGDQDLDLAVVLKNANSLLVLTNDGFGGFTLGSITPVGARPVWLAAGTLDANASVDLVTANRDANSLTVLLNNGDGTFTASTVAVGDEPRAVAVGDFNGDNAPDLVATNHRDRTISILTNNGSGGFGGGVSISVGGQVRPDGVTTGDLDGDMDMDIAVATSGNALNLVAVFINTAGTFSGPFNYAVGGVNPDTIVAVDLNCDDMLDLVTSDQDSNNISVLVNTGAAVFGPAETFGVGTRPGTLIAANLDNDRDADVVVSNRDSNDVSILINQTCAGVVLGDMNCDGVLNGGDIDPFFLALGDPAAYATQFPNCDPRNGDINGDGRLDGGDIDPFFQCLGGNCP